MSAVRVDGGPDVADQHIVEHAVAGDLVVTQDIPLAALLVPGESWCSTLAARNTPRKQSESVSRSATSWSHSARRASTPGPAPWDSRHKHAFAAALDRALTRMLRAS